MGRIYDRSGSTPLSVLFIVWLFILLFLCLLRCILPKCRNERMQDPNSSESGRSNQATESLIQKMDERSIVYVDNGCQKVQEEFDPEKDVETRSSVRDDVVVNISQQQQRLLHYSNACAICLESYQDGQKLVFSEKSSLCPHIFHGDCMKELVITQTAKGIYSIACPCCRLTFVEAQMRKPLRTEINQSE